MESSGSPGSWLGGRGPGSGAGVAGCRPPPVLAVPVSLERGASRHVRSPGRGGGHAAGGTWGGESGAGQPREVKGSRRQRPGWTGAQTD